MSDPLAALERLMKAQTEDEAAAILADSPELLSPEFDDMIAEEIESARREGDEELTDSLSDLRQLLTSLRSMVEWAPPDLPGAEIAADLVHMLTDPNLKAPIPHSALTDVFFTVVDDLRRHAQKHHIDEIVRDLKRLDKRVAAAGGRFVVPAGQTPLLVTVEEWVNTETWTESQSYLAAHRQQLLSADTAAVLAILQEGARAVEAEEDAYLMRQHLSILAAARAGNAAGVYAKLIADEESDEEAEEVDEEDEVGEDEDEDDDGVSEGEEGHNHTDGGHSH
jgi:hypothetical protein